MTGRENLGVLLMAAGSWLLALTFTLLAVAIDAGPLFTGVVVAVLIGAGALTLLQLMALYSKMRLAIVLAALPALLVDVYMLSYPFLPVR